MFKVHSIFRSISGEVGPIIQGTPCTFIRFHGCNLECPYCDAKEAIDPNFPWKRFRKEDMLSTIKRYGLPVVLTGGEPFLQEGLENFIKELILNNIKYQVETNGTVPVGKVHNLVMDYKFDNVPLAENLEHLSSKDWLKLMVTKVENLEFVRLFLKIYKGKNLAVTTCRPNLYPKIQEILIQEKSRAILNVQIHKTIGVQ